ncbi:hypothetical protein PsAD2_03037 [Pseudovibrio axinellae]|uniref:Phage tail assembly protein n=1 Tax=Pseudovibrio axinellae TaxID=989403 RepID=A0A165XHA6_9HYPH|nr:phage tail assembly protein [Pseudovibrio axinellae]KZL17700.1 hypothetical protein PsAD2_03037 [Pseudovibrio axinellae]SER43097.1 Phage tail assembly chaperone protein, E, or 41 or 14 [Pseudovibrio axinellae]
MTTHDTPNVGSMSELDKLTESELEKTMQMEPSMGSAEFFPKNKETQEEPRAIKETAVQRAPERRVLRRGAPAPVTVSLTFPIEIYEGDVLVKEITHVTLNRPFGRTIVQAQANDTNVLAVVCGLTNEEFDGLDGEDFYTLTEKAVPFLPKRLIMQAQEQIRDNDS